MDKVKKSGCKFCGKTTPIGCDKCLKRVEIEFTVNRNCELNYNDIRASLVPLSPQKETWLIIKIIDEAETIIIQGHFITDSIQSFNTISISKQTNKE